MPELEQGPGWNTIPVLNLLRAYQVMIAKVKLDFSVTTLAHVIWGGGWEPCGQGQNDTDWEGEERKRVLQTYREKYNYDLYHLCLYNYIAYLSLSLSLSLYIYIYIYIYI